MKDELKQELVSIGFEGDTFENAEFFLKEKYYFNIRNVECFINIGGCNGKGEWLSFKYIPTNSLEFFFKDYAPNESDDDWLHRTIMLAVKLINVFKIK